MKRITIFLVISLFLVSFVIAQSDNSVNGNQNDDAVVSSVRDSVKEAIKNRLTEDQIRAIITARNQIRTNNQTGECPEKCTCTGSATKCFFANGTREMTIVAGKSGNIIFQVKGINVSTRVMLYKSNETIYGIFRNNETRKVKMLPDQVKEKIRERIQRHLENENISLDEDGTYHYIGEKKARLFFIFPVRATIRAELDPETGKIIRVRNPWWGFLAKDDGEQIVGASCGTVTPGENDNCCVTKGFEIWNATTNECEFSAE